MPDAIALDYTDANGAPLAGLTLTVVDYRDFGGGTRPVLPTVVDRGNGRYLLTPSAADESVGTVALVDAGPTAYPRRVTLAIYQADGGNQAWAWHLEDAAGNLWAGAAPTWAVAPAYQAADGTPRTPPTLLPLAGAYLWVAVPTVADAQAGAHGRVVSPAGAYPESLALDTSPSPVPTAPPGSLSALMATQLVGAYSSGFATVTLTLGANLFAGPVRPAADGVPLRAVFVMVSGGQPPLPYLGGSDSWKEARCEVVVRGSAHEYEAGEALARALHQRMHLASLPGLVFVLAEESEPVFVGTDDEVSHRWAMAFRVGFRG